MPLYMCSKCGSVDNTATGGFWHQEYKAIKAKQPVEPLCSACNPDMGKWHDQFPRRSAEGMVRDKRGFVYTQEEADNYFKHLGPSKPVVLPATS